jgi:hypothetical protein
MRRLWFLFFGVAATVSCSKPEADSKTWTLATGVSIVEANECVNSTQQSMAVKKISSDYLVTAQGFFTCDAEISQPYLTLEKDGRATLVINSPRSSSNCECNRAVTVKIVDRLEPKNTLYVLTNEEVLGHLVLP